MLGRLLRLAEYRVVAFPSGESFLASVAAFPPDCALLDIRMPGLSGFEVQSRLQAADAGIPVILMTASDEEDLERLALVAGAARLLRKPFTSDELLAAIDSALQR